MQTNRDSTRSVLVAYGSRHGATAEIAQWIGEELRLASLDVDVRPAGEVRDTSEYDAVVLGGSVYATRWDHTARRFARRHARALRDRPVWLFSSGPVDHSADEEDLAPVRGAARAAQRLHARAHVTFGGRIGADTPGFVARSMATIAGGDYRNEPRIRAWGREIAATVGRVAASPPKPTG